MINHNNKGTYGFLKNTVRNNTFNITDSVNAIKRMIYNSYRYLYKVEESYTSIPKYKFYTKDDLKLDNKNRYHILINHNFIENSKKEKYRLSTYYDKYVSLDDIRTNTKIFSYYPIVFINGSVTTDIEVKFLADETADIKFTNSKKYSDYLSSNKEIDIVWFKNITKYTSKVFGKASTLYNNGQCSFDSTDFDRNTNIFAYIIPEDSSYESSNIYPCSTNGNKITFNIKPNNYLLNLGDTKITVYLFSIRGLKFVNGNKSFTKLPDDTKYTSIVTIYDNNKTYSKPIPKDSLILFANSNNQTDGKMDLNSEIIEHYPNIYEIKNDGELSTTSLKIYYIYNDFNNDLSYIDKLEIVHKYMVKLTNSAGLEKCLLKFLNKEVSDEYLNSLFNTYWNFKDDEFFYKHIDFWDSDYVCDKDFFYQKTSDKEIFNTKVKDYDFIYKINKMQDIVDSDFSVMEYYGLDVNKRFESYFLDVDKAIEKDPEYMVKKERYNSYTMDFDENEEVLPEYKIDFVDENGNPLKHYVFIFRNEDSKRMYYNIFINGKFVPRTNYTLNYGYKVVQHKYADYIYIPETYFTSEDSVFIEIEKLISYKIVKPVQFTDNSLMDISFKDAEYYEPTLLDLNIMDTSNHAYDMSLFDIFVKIPDDSQYAVEDHRYTSDNIVKDDTTGKYFISVNDILADIKSATDSKNVQRGIDLLPIKYINLTDIKIRCKDSSLYNTDINIIINKIPYIFTKKMTGTGIPKIRLIQSELIGKKSVTHIRTFIDRYFIPSTYKVEEISPSEIYLIPNMEVKENEVIDFEISPYSYEMEFYLKHLPKTGVVDFGNSLSRPFNFKYYDVYLNGVKLNYTKITRLSSTQVIIHDVKDNMNLAVYRRDRDYEYYISTNSIEPTKRLLDHDDSKIVTNLIDDEEKKEPEETEKDRWERVISEHDYQYILFYLLEIIPQGIPLASSWNIKKEKLNEDYPVVYDTFSNKSNRIVMRPNRDHSINKIVLMIGQNTDMEIPEHEYIIIE